MLVNEYFQVVTSISNSFDVALQNVGLSITVAENFRNKGRATSTSFTGSFCINAFARLFSIHIIGLDEKSPAIIVTDPNGCRRNSNAIQQHDILLYNQSGRGQHRTCPENLVSNGK